MLKPLLDLPDPLTQSDPSSTPASDDLLSQLAGDEIERLLSNPPYRPSLRAAPSPASNAANEHRNADLSADVAPLSFPTPPPSSNSDIESAWGRADIAAHSDADAQVEVSAQLDQLFNALSPAATPAPASNISSPALPAAPPETSSAHPIKPPPTPRLISPPTPFHPTPVGTVPLATPLRATPPVAPRKTSKSSSPSIHTPTEEDPELLEYVNALRPDLVSATTAIPSGLESSTTQLTGQSIDPLTPPAPRTPQPTPAWIQFLEWLNSPFTSIPDRARIALGKIAIIALANAIAVLIYVVLFH